MPPEALPEGNGAEEEPEGQAQPAQVSTSEALYGVPEGGLFGLKGAIERSRIKRTPPEALTNLAGSVKKPEGMKFVRVTPYPVPGWMQAKLGSELPGMAQFDGPWYDGESQEEAEARTRAIAQRKLKTADKFFYSNFIATPSFGLSRHMTERFDQEAMETLGPEWSTRVARQGSISGMFLPTRVNPPALLFGVVARPLTAGVRGLLSGAFRLGGGLRAGFQAGAEGANIYNQTFMNWLGRQFGKDWARKVTPGMVEAAQEALRKTGGRVMPDGRLFIPTSASAESVALAKQALAALRDGANRSYVFKLFRSLPEAGGLAGGGAAVGGAYNMGELSRAKTPSEAIETLGRLPGDTTRGAGYALGIGGVIAGGAAALRGIAARYPGAFEGVTPFAPKPRLLGAPGEVIEPGARPRPSPPGPVAPPVSMTFARPSITPAPNFEGPTMSALDEAFGAAQTAPNAAEADRAVQGLRAAAEITQAKIVAAGPAGELATFRGWQNMSTPRTQRPPVALWNVPLPTGGETTVTSSTLEKQGWQLPPPPLPEEMGQAQIALFQGVRDLIGRDHDEITKLLGVDHRPVVFGGGGPITLRDVPRFVHTARWASGLLEAARRHGVSLDETLQKMPPPPLPVPEALAARLKGIADTITAAAPSAAVGPPPELGISPELAGQEPVSFPGREAAPAMPTDPEGAISSAPTSTQWGFDAARAARKQQMVTASLAGGQPFRVGYLQATKGEGLNDTDLPQVAVFADGEGRLFGTIQDSQDMGGTADVDITSGLRPLALPASAEWRWVPERTAPVQFHLDPKTEALLIDKERTHGVRWVRDNSREAVRQSATGGLTDPSRDPLQMLSSLASTGLTPANAERVGEILDALETAHRGKIPTPDQARALSGPEPADWEIARTHSKMLNEHAAIGSLIELQKAAKDDVAQLPLWTGEEGGDVFEHLARRRWEQAPSFTARGEERLVDPESLLPPSELHALISHPALAALNDTYSYILNTIREGLLAKFRDPRHATGEHGGIVLGRTYHGLNVSASLLRTKENVILFNPLVTWKVISRGVQTGTIPPEKATSRFIEETFATAIHELTHQEARGHAVAFSTALTRNLQVLFDPVIQQMAVLLANRMDELRIPSALETLIYDIHSRPPGTDLLVGAKSTVSAREGEPPGGEELPQPGGEGGPEPTGAVPGGAPGAPGGLAPSTPVGGGSALARLRAEALSWSASNKGWSKKPALFAALTDEEKFLSLLSRIKGGTMNRAQLDRMNPATWSTKPLKYAEEAKWKPTDEQFRSLKLAWAHRKQLEAGRARVEGKLRQQVAAKAPPTAAPWKPVPPDELMKLDPATLDKWAKEEPELYHQTMKNIWPSLDGAFSSVNAPEAIEKLQVLKDALRAMEQKTLSERPAPPSSGSPLSGFKRLMVRSKAQRAAAMTAIKFLERPAGAIGPRKQTAGFHPSFIQQEVEEGRWDRGIFKTGYEADLKMHQAVLRYFNDMAPLAAAAARDPKLNDAIALALEHRINEASGELDRPEWTFKVRVQGVEHTVKLSEWLPQLRKVYDEIIEQAEKEESYRLRIEQADYHNSALWAESKLRERELAYAHAEYQPLTFADWNDIPPALQAEVRKAMLRQDPPGPETPEPVWMHRRDLPIFDTNVYSYRKLHGLWKQAAHEYTKRKDRIAEIASGSLREQGYVTRQRKLADRDLLHDILRNPYSLAARYTNPKLRAKYLEERQTDVPTLGWLDGWNLYIPILMRKIHLEPALMRIERKLPELDAFQQEYTRAWMGALKGTEPPLQIILNRAAFEHQLHQPDVMDYMMQAATGLDTGKITKEMANKDEIPEKIWSRALENYTGWMYMTLIGPIMTGALTITEFSYLAREFSKPPTARGGAMSKVPTDLLRALWWVPKAIAMTSAEGTKETLSWLKSVAVPGTPRWYADPTIFRATDFLHEVENEIERHGGQPGSVRRKIAKAWGPFLRATEFMYRGTTYHALLDRFRRHYPDADEWMQKAWAAAGTNDAIQAFNRTSVSPMTTGPIGRGYMPLKRFVFAHTELAIHQVMGTGEAARRGLAATGLPTVQGPPWTQEAPPEQPPLPPPPDVPGSEHEQWDPEERAEWDKINEPASIYGSSYPAGPDASLAWGLSLMLGMPLTGFFLWYIGSLIFEEDDNTIYDLLIPFSLQRLAELPGLHWWPETFNLMYYSAKGTLLPLTEKEAKKKERATQEVLWDIPLLGRHLRNLYFEEQLRKATEREALKRLHLGSGKFPIHLPGGKLSPGLLYEAWKRLPPDVRKELEPYAPSEVRKRIKQGLLGKSSGLEGVELPPPLED